MRLGGPDPARRSITVQALAEPQRLRELSRIRLSSLP
jgi:hypothetical protein